MAEVAHVYTKSSEESLTSGTDDTRAKIFSDFLQASVFRAGKFISHRGFCCPLKGRNWNSSNNIGGRAHIQIIDEYKLSQKR